MPRDVRAYLSDIVDACRAIEAAVSGLDYTGYAESRLVRSSVEREFIIIGEAVAALSHVSPRIFDAISNARRIVDFRNQLTHEYPTVDIADLEISVAANVLTVKGERRAGKKDDAKTYREEMSVGRFQRTLQLPLPIDAEKVDAALKDGTLRIVLPKHEQLKPRQISVQAK